MTITIENDHGGRARRDCRHLGRCSAGGRADAPSALLSRPDPLHAQGLPPLACGDGTVVGGVAGAVVGHSVLGHGLLGTAAGAVGGAVAGGAVDRSMTAHRRCYYTR